MALDTILNQAATESGGDSGKLMRLPKKSIQQEYLLNILLDKRDFSTILKSLTRVDDPRPEIMARQIINDVLDDDIRYALIDKFDEAIRAVKESTTDADERSKKIISTSQDFVGEVNSYLDEYFALHKGQEIGDV